MRTRIGSVRITSDKLTYRYQFLKSGEPSAGLWQYPAFMMQIDLGLLADNWIAYWHGDSAKRIELSEATDLYDFTYEEPEKLWLLILEIHSRDQSIAIQQVLSAGPVEDLLAKHGEGFIERVEAEARRDPNFAKLLGGVWKTR